ncbi:DUF1479-domain-containing protein [Aureobasidium pullulans]|uniref:DUF1479-domain-containing protein n=1 Tax=Aureobasidium pullulans TaxID=5580 RepID=A0A4S9M1M2_AURPU|nr:DUF1479-domain-containing protein [Aureobasidium pullulans]
MPGRVRQWPWDEYPQENINDEDFRKAKEAIIREHGAEALRKSWIEVCGRLSLITEDVSVNGNKLIPVIPADSVLEEGFSPEEEQRIRETGCVVVRGVIPESTARQLYSDLKQYVSENRSQIKGWPEESPSMLQLYNSPTQNAVRSHPNQLRLQRLLNELWHDHTERTSSEPLVYLDGVRDRPPQQPFLGLGPHIDAGSLSRWLDPAYRRSYSAVFGGKSEEWDCWNLSVRQDAVQDLFKAPAHSSVFRAFQGWTALTSSGPHRGSILLYPNVSALMAYVLLRPFFCPPEDPMEVMEASKWSFDETGCSFPGTIKDQSQRLSRTSHPHLRLQECLVHVPEIMPGDTVWWHSDVCHAVDPEHQGSENASVVYVAACPTTLTTKEYVKQQLADTLAGFQPKDANGDLKESMLAGYQGHASLSEEARKAFGYYL